MVVAPTDQSPPKSRFANSGGFFRSPSVSGRWAERYVAWRLRFRGWKIESCNLKTPMGEVDLLAWDGRTLVIVEVKYRSRQRGWPLSRVQASRLRRAAQWLAGNKNLARGIRIDLIEVNRGFLPFFPTLSHLKAAVTMEVGCLRRSRFRDR